MVAPHQNTCLTNHACLTKFASVSHQNRTCLTQFAPVSKSTEPVLPQPFGPLLRRSSASTAHAFPTRPTDNTTFATSISQIPTTADHRALSLRAGALPCPTAIPKQFCIPSHSCPLDSMSQPSPSLPAHLGFPTLSFGSSLALRTRHASSRPAQRGGQAPAKAE